MPTPDLALAAELATLLHAHDAIEEDPGGVYDQCEALLGPEVSAELAERAQGVSAPPLAPHFDGERAHRTAESALGAALRTRQQLDEKARDP